MDVKRRGNDVRGEKPMVYLVNCLLKQQKMYFTNKLGGVMGYIFIYLYLFIYIYIYILYIYTNVDIFNWKDHNNFTAMSLK